MNRRRLLGLLLAAGLAGCSAEAPVGPSTSPTAPAVLTVAGVCLDELGVQHGLPDRVCLPAGVSLTTTYDGDQTLLLLGPAAEAETVWDYLLHTLPDLGWQVTPGEDGLRFRQDDWQGSFAIGQTLWGLTVRSE